ncbi:MAG: hypothetical protein U1F77_16385 [Kiritimatiellia bacterium]
MRVRADHVLFRMAPEVLGANMEDLHYQMVGGIDSQMLHGESFYEHSPTELAPLKAQLDGFDTVNGAWSVSNGVVSVTVRPGDGTPWLEPGLDGGRPPQPRTAEELNTPEKDPGARMTSRTSAPDDTVETRVSLRFPAGENRSASLIAHVPPNHSDNGWNWYSPPHRRAGPDGADAAVARGPAQPARGIPPGRPRVVPANEWVAAPPCGRGRTHGRQVGGREVIAGKTTRPLPPGRFGVATRGRVDVRDLSLVSGRPAGTTSHCSRILRRRCPSRGGAAAPDRRAEARLDLRRHQLRRSASSSKTARANSMRKCRPRGCRAVPSRRHAV